MCHENGFDIVADAFILLKKRVGYDDVKLIATGGSTGADTKYIYEIKKRFSKEKLNDHVEFHEEFEGTGRKTFFDRVALISVPVRNGEAFGMYLLESMASGVPVVQPALGAFPEIVNLVNGGIVYQPNTPEALCDALANLLSDSSKLETLSQNARSGVETNFNIHDHAKEMIATYQTLLQNNLTQ
jgi:glycosyltransferase involved in cell wall biosynthesis